MTWILKFIFVFFAANFIKFKNLRHHCSKRWIHSWDDNLAKWRCYERFIKWWNLWTVTFFFILILNHWLILPVMVLVKFHARVQWVTSPFRFVNMTFIFDVFKITLIRFIRYLLAICITFATFWLLWRIIKIHVCIWWWSEWYGDWLFLRRRF